MPLVTPDFGDETTAGRKLAIICSKGNLDMAYPGLILANAALGEGVETHLFFTFWGFDMITRSRMHDLKFTMLGNTATHLPQGLGGLPGMTAMATWTPRARRWSRATFDRKPSCRNI
jgi:peroxiredoxin family protein